MQLICDFFFSSSTLFIYFSNGKSSGKSCKPFIMRVFEDEIDDTDSEGEEDRSSVAATRFNCDAIYLRC